MSTVPSNSVPLIQHALVNIRTSSNYSPNHTQFNLILNHTENPANSNDGASSWSSSYVDLNQYVVLGGEYPKEIVSIATQGRGDGDQWVTTYKIRYSVDNISWFDYNNGQVIQANTNRNSIVVFNFPSPLLCRSISIHPVTWNNHISMRMEVYAKQFRHNYVQQGEVTTELNGAMNSGSGSREVRVNVAFPKPFASIPKVAVTFSRMDCNTTNKQLRAGVDPIEVTKDGFVAKFFTWSDSLNYSLKADYIAVEEI